MNEKWAIYDPFDNGLCGEFYGKTGKKKAIKFAQNDADNLNQSVVVVGINKDNKKVLESIIINPKVD